MLAVTQQHRSNLNFTRLWGSCTYLPYFTICRMDWFLRRHLHHEDCKINQITNELLPLPNSFPKDIMNTHTEAHNTWLRNDDFLKVSRIRQPPNLFLWTLNLTFFTLLTSLQVSFFFTNFFISFPLCCMNYVVQSLTEIIFLSKNPFLSHSWVHEVALNTSSSAIPMSNIWYQVH